MLSYRNREKLPASAFLFEMLTSYKDPSRVESDAREIQRTPIVSMMWVGCGCNWV
jgi:hypothetical protein